MSEYQYHEWQTIDRVLSPGEQAEVNMLSSHIEVSSSSAVVTYHWSDFKHDPIQVLLDYFDAYFYFANWGNRRLAFRFPKGQLDEGRIQAYCDGEYISFETFGNYQVLDIDFNPEDGGDWFADVHTDLSSFVRLREDLLEGDCRLLYLAWLKAATLENLFNDEVGYAAEEDEDSPVSAIEPPVPPGLKELSPALQYFSDQFEIDPLLIRAAAETSPDLQPAAAVDYRELVGRLPRSESDDFLARLAEGESGLGWALRRRLAEFLPAQKRVEPAGRRHLEQLFIRAQQLELAEQIRQAEAARAKHIAELKALAAREAQAWQEVDSLLQSGKNAALYNQATDLLEKLEQLSVFQDTVDRFFQQVQGLVQKYAARPSLMRRWESKGWVKDG